ncbi:MAG: hypothetical protein VZR53_13480 [Prevotella sp.]|nr:hypothetical protein [Prevotella sp.]
MSIFASITSNNSHIMVNSAVQHIIDFSKSVHLSCEHPLFLLHPYFHNRFVAYGFVNAHGIIYDFTSKSAVWRASHYSKLVKTLFSSQRLSPSVDTLDDYNVVSSDGVCFPMFILARCGHCSLCTAHKVSDLSSRCALETYSCKFRPLFVTLTYDNEHLPVNGVSVKDTQDFLKRLRVNLDRFFGRHIDLRYVISAEYGKNTHRPHYHLILWNMPYFPDYKSAICNRIGLWYTQYMRGFERMKTFIHDSWKNGFVSVEVCRDPSARYVMKYIGKGSKVPQGMSPVFTHWSRRRGLGYYAFLEFKDYLKDNPTVSTLQFTDPKVGKIQEVSIPDYFRRLLAPSASASVPPKVKDMFVRARMLYFNASDYSSRTYLFPEVKIIYDEIKNLFDPFVSMADMDIHPLYSDLKSDYQEMSVLSISTIYDELNAIYFDLLDYLPLVYKFMYSQDWKSRFIDTVIPLILSDNRSVQDKVFNANYNVNKQILKSTL